MMYSVHLISPFLTQTPIWPRPPKIKEDEAMVYLSDGATQTALCDPEVSLKVAGTTLNVTKGNKTLLDLFEQKSGLTVPFCVYEI